MKACSLAFALVLWSACLAATAVAAPGVPDPAQSLYGPAAPGGPALDRLGVSPENNRACVAGTWRQYFYRVQLRDEFGDPVVGYSSAALVFTACTAPSTRPSDFIPPDGPSDANGILEWRTNLNFGGPDPCEVGVQVGGQIFHTIPSAATSGGVRSPDENGSGFIDANDISIFGTTMTNDPTLAYLYDLGASERFDDVYTSENDCSVIGFHTSCQDDGCPHNQGACCLLGVFCITASQANCEQQGGVFAGGYSVCGPIGPPFNSPTCPQTGACCIDGPNGPACAQQDSAACAAAGGTFYGPGTECPTTTAAIVLEPGGEVFVHVIGPPVECAAIGKASAAFDRSACNSGPFLDPWESPADGSMCHTFGVPESPPIPADFFGPGSEPFVGSVCLEGVPLGIPEFGNADTVIERDQDPFDRCDLPSANEVTVNIEIVQLSLHSVAPIQVIVNAVPEQWDVAVDLSQVPASPGTLTATKTHCNGGTYTSTLHVQPRFTFTKVGNPGQVRVLDTGLAGIPAVDLEQTVSAEWVSDVDLKIQANVDQCSSFHPGFVVENPVGCDCNGNQVSDRCEISSGLLPDCNGNFVPDACDISQGTSLDANLDGVPDECDVTSVPGEIVTSLPLAGRLRPSFPNPFNPSTTIRYDLPEATHVKVSIYSAAGRLVRVLQNAEMPAGTHELRWDGQDEQGRRITSGVYFCKLETPKWGATQTLVLIK